MRYFTNLTVVLIKITKQMKISVFRQEALSDVIFFKSADRMRLLEKDNMASKIRRFYELQRTISP